MCPNSSCPIECYLWTSKQELQKILRCLRIISRKRQSQQRMKVLLNLQVNTMKMRNTTSAKKIILLRLGVLIMHMDYLTQ